MKDLFTEEEKRNRRSGIIGTIVFHMALLILFFFFAFRTPLPLPEEQGILVNFGQVEEAGGDPYVDELTPIEESVPEEVVQEESDPVEESADVSSNDEVVTQEVDESVRLEEEKRKAEQQKQAEIERQRQEAERQAELERQRKEQERLEQERKAQELRDKASKAFGKAGSGQGSQTGSGDQGDPNGDPNSSNTGSGGKAGSSSGGSGNGASLAGRSLVKAATIQDDSQIEGRIVVKIWVNRDGIVTRAVAGAPGTTISNSALRKKCEEASKKARFNRDPKASDTQIGTYIFNFTLN